MKDKFSEAADALKSNLKGISDELKKENLKKDILDLHENSDSLTPDILFKKMPELYKKYGTEAVNDALSEYVKDIMK